VNASPGRCPMGHCHAGPRFDSTNSSISASKGCSSLQRSGDVANDARALRCVDGRPTVSAPGHFVEQAEAGRRERSPACCSCDIEDRFADSQLRRSSHVLGIANRRCRRGSGCQDAFPTGRSVILPARRRERSCIARHNMPHRNRTSNTSRRAPADKVLRRPCLPTADRCGIISQGAPCKVTPSCARRCIQITDGTRRLLPSSFQIK
jgi:hypothetical protein